MQTFQENKPVEKQKIPEYDPLNQCRRCGIKGGVFIDKKDGKKVGIFLLRDARGFMICNLCKDAGFLIPYQKMSKAEKKKFRKFKLEMGEAIKLPHITLDAKGNEIK